MQHDFRFSVIIPCHNAGRWIGQALDSVARQIVRPHEIIVIDDASSDDSVAQIRATGIDVRLIQVQERNAAAARNRGIEAATGDWIALLDADDRWYPSHLLRAAEFLDGSNDVAYRGFCDDMDVQGNTRKVTKPQPMTKSCRGLTHDIYPDLELREMYFGHSGMVIRRDRLLAVGGYDPTQVRRHDIDMWLRVIHGQTWCYDAVPTAVYRVDTPGSICSNIVACEYYYLRALLKNRPQYADPSMDRVIERSAKRAMSLAFMNGTHADFIRARDLAWPYLPAHFRACYRSAALAPAPLRLVIGLKRWVFGLRRGCRLDGGQVPGSQLTHAVGSMCRNIGKAANQAAAYARLSVLPESSGLIVNVFHSIVPDDRAFSDGRLYPKNVVTVRQLEQSVEFYLRHGFRAVSLREVLAGLPPRGRYVMFSFDDGYANNSLAIPVLERHNVPGLFALTTDNIAKQLPYWWDVVYRRERERGTPEREIDSLINCLTQTPAADTRDALACQYGSAYGTDMLSCVGDDDRPWRPDEVRALSRHPLISWANHSHLHEDLSLHDAAYVTSSLRAAQDCIESWTGSRPQAIVYPYGAHNEQVRTACRNMGLVLGFTLAGRKQRLPIAPNTDASLRIRRFPIVSYEPIERQCVQSRFDWKPSWFLQRGRECS